MAAAAAVSLLLLAAGYAAGDQTLRQLGVWGALIAGVGAAPLQLRDDLELVVRSGVAVLIGLSVASLVGTVMVLLPLWHPFVAALLVAVPAGYAHVIAVRRALEEHGRPAFLDAVRNRSHLRRALSPSLACTVLGCALWLGAAVAAGHVNPGVGGFLVHISPVWFAGLVLLVAAIALAHGRSELHIAVPVLALLAALTITPAVVYGLPRSQSAIKHVQLVQLILQHHHLTLGHSIYYAYSGFFSGMAWLARLADVANPIGLATFWPALIGLLGAIELRFLFGRVVPSGQRCWAGIVIVVLANAVGQDYFSPQSVGFVVALGVYALAIEGRYPSPFARRATLALLVGAGCAMALTHELSPYISGGVLITLALFRMVRPRWAAATALVPAGIWAAANYNVLGGYVNLSALGNLSNFSPPQTIASSGLARVPIVNTSSDALLVSLLILTALAIVGLARNIRRRSAWAVILSSGVGLVFIAINPYGREGIFRAALFGIPWLTMLALAVVRRPPWRRPALAALSTVMLGLFLVAQFGLDQTNVVRRADVSAYHVWLAHSPPGSYKLEVGGTGDLPTVLETQFHQLLWDALFNEKNKHQEAIHSRTPPTASDFTALERSYLSYGKTISHTPPHNMFVTWSPTAAQYSVDYGVETMANSIAWRNFFIASPSWKILFSSDGTYLFRHV